MSDWRDFKSVRVRDQEWMAFTDEAAQHIYNQVLELGYRWSEDHQTHYFARPDGSDGQMGGLMMQWTEIGEDAVVSDLKVPDISGLSLSQKVDLLTQLERDGIGGLGLQVPDDVEGAEVSE